jgi:ADP-ribose pyrophosphatase YjhB (NUDIX family)
MRKVFNPTKPHGIRAVGIVIYGDKILLMKRRKKGHEYFAIPGGGVEDNNETVEEAVVRELKEETCIDVRVERLVYHHDLIDHSDQYFYLCTYLGGKVELGGPEKEKLSEDNYYEPLWMPTKELSTLHLYPLEIRDWLIQDLKGRFPAEPRKAILKKEEIRNS